jgi:hypothetical protein
MSISGDSNVQLTQAQEAWTDWADFPINDGIQIMTSYYVDGTMTVYLAAPINPSAYFKEGADDSYSDVGSGYAEIGYFGYSPGIAAIEVRQHGRITKSLPLICKVRKGLSPVNILATFRGAQSVSDMAEYGITFGEIS